MRAWILVLAVVLATFQAIVRVASTDAAMGLLSSSIITQSSSSTAHSKAQHHRPRMTWSSPTLSFAAIVAIPAQSEPISLTNLNNIVLNSDNVKYPSQEDQNSAKQQQQPQQLLVPTNSSSTEEESSPSAKSVVNTKSSSSKQQQSRRISSSSSNRSSSSSNNSINNISGNSNLINPNKIASGDEARRAQRRQRKHGQRRRRRMQQRRNQLSASLSSSSSSSSAENSVQQEQEEVAKVRKLSSNELSAEVSTAEDEEEEDVVEPEPPRAKPDPETLVTIEKNLLSLFGFKKRPSIDRSKVVIPEAMRRMYAETTGMELDLPDAPKPNARGHMTANTVRSFTHEGESKLRLLFGL